MHGLHAVDLLQMSSKVETVALLQMVEKCLALGILLFGVFQHVAHDGLALVVVREVVEAHAHQSHGVPAYGVEQGYGFAVAPSESTGKRQSWMAGSTVFRR